MRNSSSVLPAASQLNSTHTATRVPAKTAAPLWISGSRSVRWRWHLRPCSRSVGAEPVSCPPGQTRQQGLALRHLKAREGSACPHQRPPPTTTHLWTPTCSAGRGSDLSPLPCHVLRATIGAGVSVASSCTSVMELPWGRVGEGRGVHRRALILRRGTGGPSLVNRRTSPLATLADARRGAVRGALGRLVPCAGPFADPRP